MVDEEMKQPVSKPMPSKKIAEKEMPDEKLKQKEMPDETQKEKELPPVVNPENTITVGNDTIEIKPTKVKYQRNRTAVFYRVIEMYPLPDILSMDRGIIDPERDGDKCLFDWCCAVTDNPKFVVKHYDEMDTETIERLLKIYRRLNHIDDKDEQSKNRMAKETSN